MASRVLSKHPPKRSRADWYTLVKTMHDNGLNGVQIARALGISRSFASSLLNDPDGSRDRARKARNGGLCVDCGGPTCGGDGRRNAPERCASCREAFNAREYRVWTREAIIEAIQRFAREHGRPPHAPDWNKKSRHEDSYPYATSCYGKKPTSPFPTWADAIEAAGFPRPRVGGYERDDEWRIALSRRTRVWYRDNTIAALQAWAEKHGRSPSRSDWMHAAPGRPQRETVCRMFGGWRKALAAAGLPQNRNGRRQ